MRPATEPPEPEPYAQSQSVPAADTPPFPPGRPRGTTSQDQRAIVWLFRSKCLAEQELIWLKAHGHGPCEVHPNGPWFVVRSQAPAGIA
jgi:hypothetical protein